MTLLRTLGPQAAEVVVTLAEELRAEGRVEGQVEAEVRILLRLLTLRFGPLESQTETRVREATPEQRELWTSHILTATTLDELFRT